MTFLRATLRTRFLAAASCLLSAGASLTSAAGPVPAVERLRHHVEQFNGRDTDLYPQSIPNAQAYDFLKENIPLFDAPDEDFVRTYYFRWWVYRKHVKATPEGRVITEFLPPVPWAGKHNTISCALGHHLMEGRWLRDRGIMRENLQFWLGKTDGGHLRRYSTWLGTGLWELHEVHPDEAFLKDLLPSLVANYEGWEATHLCADGLFQQTDNADGMEVSIGGSGRRPTINSYLYGDARVIAKIARLARNSSLAGKYDRKADDLRKRVLATMWDDDAGFFRVLPGSEGEKRADVSELLGYTPWLTGLADTGERHSRAWRLLTDSKGFLAPYGLTTAEQSHPQFAISGTGHECQWNGPSWPYLTSATLKSLANVLHAGGKQPLTRGDYFKLLANYTRSQRLTAADGTVLPWIDENQDPYSGEWLARKLLIERHSPIRERGKDYNHSSYCDLILSGLVGIRPAVGNKLEIDPLLPPGRWRYFSVERVRYHDREVSVVWDEDGLRYGRGKGLRLIVDGKVIASRPDLGKLSAVLPAR
ncbi:trehalase family glycosidase [Luteolibacter flavescens]|uniref:Trehalase family glycosidase n=1 Tax=Luteolibacter flavescens TaxID=1859460 RepID=A0ABT3FPU7_9BACT|nr:glycosyl hydrolase family 65 protein [Luteolibacter flavescens]MCW1885472.1 trehalase family glycosidase [Luteolibacter flavescens]